MRAGERGREAMTEVKAAAYMKILRIPYAYKCVRKRIFHMKRSAVKIRLQPRSNLFGFSCNGFETSLVESFTTDTFTFNKCGWQGLKNCMRSKNEFHVYFLPFASR